MSVESTVQRHYREKLAALEAEVARLTSAVRWALGENGEFPLWDDGGDDTRRPADGKKPRIGYFWWRTELRQRAFGASPEPKGPTPQEKQEP